MVSVQVILLSDICWITGLLTGTAFVQHGEYDLLSAEHKVGLFQMLHIILPDNVPRRAASLRLRKRVIEPWLDVSLAAMM